MTNNNINTNCNLGTVPASITLKEANIIRYVYSMLNKDGRTLSSAELSAFIYSLSAFCDFFGSFCPYDEEDIEYAVIDYIKRSAEDGEPAELDYIVGVLFSSDWGLADNYMPNYAEVLAGLFQLAKCDDLDAGAPESARDLQEFDRVTVHLFDSCGKEITTDASGRLFRVERVNGKLGIFWNKDGIFSPFDSFAPSVVFDRLPVPRASDDSERRKLSLISSVEDLGCVPGRRVMYHVGDKFIIELTRCESCPGSSGDLMTTWKRHGFISKILPTHWSVATYFTDAEGDCFGWYNIQETAKHRINFSAIMEATEENAAHLLAACIDLMERGIKYPAA